MESRSNRGLRKFELRPDFRSPLGEQKYPLFSLVYIHSCKTEVRLVKGGEGKNEQLPRSSPSNFHWKWALVRSFAFSPSVHSDRPRGGGIISKTRQTRGREAKINSRQIANDPSLPSARKISIGNSTDSTVFIYVYIYISIASLLSPPRDDSLPPFSFSLIESI